MIFSFDYGTWNLKKDLELNGKILELIKIKGAFGLLLVSAFWMVSQLYLVFAMFDQLSAHLCVSKFHYCRSLNC